MNEILEKARANLETEREKFRAVSNDEQDIPLKILTWESASCARFLLTEPPCRDWLFNNLVPQNIVGEIYGRGGVSKSHFMLRVIAVSLATGKAFSPFYPGKKFKVLYLGAEDSEDELHRRIWAIAENLNLFDSGDLKSNLAIKSVMGEIEPIISHDRDGNAATTAYYGWLEKTIENLKGLEVLLLDPMSRFNGLNEGANKDGTAWIRCLERLVKKYNLNIFFSHHESKSAGQSEDLENTLGRGASSIYDGCRWAAAMQNMTKTTAKKYDLLPDNYRDYVEFAVTKANWSPKLPGPIYFKRGEGGILLPTDLVKNKYHEIAEFLAQKINESGTGISRNDIKRKENDVGKNIANQLKQSFGITAEEIGHVIDFALEKNYLYEQKDEFSKKGISKVFLIPKLIP